MYGIPVAALGRLCIIATGLTIKCIVRINLIDFSLLWHPSQFNTHTKYTCIRGTILTKVDHRLLGLVF